jgi:sugar phosphate isomerase/epimerase
VYGPEQNGHKGRGPTNLAGLPLLELPSRLADFGIQTLEICHFHLPSTNPNYLTQLHKALQTNGIELWSLLIDSGDITHPQHAERDLQWIEGWIDVAGQLGARNARVIAGKAEPSPAALERSRAGLQRLVRRADTHGVRLMTENWFDLLSTPDAVLCLLDSMQGRLGLCVDFGNWRGDQKYAELAAIFPHGDSCHAKCHFDDGGAMNRSDYVRCLEMARAARLNGPYTLIYDGPDDDEWRGLALERDVVLPYLN